MKTISLLFIFLSAVGVTFAKDATFESSDGKWTDSTFDRKGRNFLVVLRTFESYKLEENKPDLELVRVTPEPKWTIFNSKKEKMSPKWNVPYAEPSGKAEHPIGFKKPLNEKQKEEIWKRADLAYEYWSKQ
ncbi:hypothetical protein VDG1235_4512 [Verrucomicrobiia bacterium DG1235]|nr:hypothetical protein VDG1235_4512 [Verrucomicrobiae bacterium DG1235]